MTPDLPHSLDLHRDWTVRPLDGRNVPDGVSAAGSIPASVPGSVHTDLLAARLIVDPYIGTNEKAQEWIGSTSWRYTTDFDWTDDGADRVDLSFLGLDTVATVTLNGRVILESRNQHRSYLVPVRDVLRAGSNDLQVDFAAPVPEADRVSLELGYRPHVNHHPYNALRKMACSFGWDWGLDTATSGIWKPVRLESWSTARLSDVTVSPTVDGATGLVTVTATVERTKAAEFAPLTLTAAIDGFRTDVEVDGTTATLHLTVDDVERWWPVGYGEPTRYDLVVELHADDAVLDRADRRIGFRTVDLDVTPDDEGTPFTVRINDLPVFVKGVNWIPDDAFPHRIDRARYAERLGQAVDANVNLLRVWGGGIFESDDFYDLADEKGLLVWQDFLLACAAYAEEDPLRSEIEAEARENVRRLGSHPSLVVLNGNNENIWGYDEWNWKIRLEGRTWGAGYYYEVFPAVVEELAPHVGYTPGSPFSPDPRHVPNDPDNGTVHIWDLWNEKDYPRYRDYRPRFVSEFGWQGPPTWSTLVESIPDVPLTPESPGMLVHQKAMEGNVKLTDGLLPHLSLPNTMPEWHWAMSLNQALAIRTAIEWFRSLQPHCMGSIVWQLNDCWPVVSWAAVDGYGRRKPLWYAIRAAYADRLVTLQPAGDSLVLAVVNDSGSEWAAGVDVERRSFAGDVLQSWSETIELGARAARTLPIPDDLSRFGDATTEYLVATVGDERAFWFPAEFRDQPLAADAFRAEAARVAGGVEVTVTAITLVRELALLADVVDPAAVVDRMLVTLQAGETAVFRVATDVQDASRFVRDDVLRSANQLVPQKVVFA